MHGINAQEITTLISSSRLKSYEKLLDGRTFSPQCLIGLYSWNKALSSALYPILQCLEVSLRNAIHEEASTCFSSSDWFDPIVKKASDAKFLDEVAKKPQIASSYYRPGVPGYSKKNKKRRWTSHLENQLKDGKKRLTNSGKNITADGVIAETMFGFWTGLFESKFRDVTSNTTLWPQLEKSVFPFAIPSQRDSSKLYHKLDKIREVRNRLSHHEPIWKAKPVHNSSDAISYLKTIVNDAVDVIGYISQDRKELLVRSGVTGRFFSLLEPSVLRAYQRHQRNKQVDKCHLRRELNKLIGRGRIPEETITVKLFNEPVVTVTPVSF